MSGVWSLILPVAEVSGRSRRTRLRIGDRCAPRSRRWAVITIFVRVSIVSWPHWTMVLAIRAASDIRKDYPPSHGSACRPNFWPVSWLLQVEGVSGVDV